MTGHAQTPSTEPAGRILVKWKADAAAQHTQTLSATNQRLLAQRGQRLQLLRRIHPQLDVLSIASVAGQTTVNRASLATTLATLQSDTRIEYAVEDRRRHVLAVPNDPLFNASANRTGQWYLQATQVAALRAVTAWNTSQGGVPGNGVIVAVLDTGILAHPDLTGKVLPGYDFVSCDQTNCNASGITYRTANDGDGWDGDPTDPGDWISDADAQTSFFADCDVADSSWHGTRVAGIIGAATDNALGIAGVGWHARLLPVRVLGKCGGYDSDILAGMRWAAGLPVSNAPGNGNPAKIINLSLGSADACNSAYQDTINSVLAAGVTVVASAGNDGGVINTPANCVGVIGVTGVRNVGTKVGFSSLGDNATISAPGGNCVNSVGACLFPIDTITNLGTTSATSFDYSSQTNPSLGTSFAAPLVAGTAALMLQSNPTLTPAQLRTRLQASARPYPMSGAVATCHIPRSSNDLQETECNCTRDTCGAGLTDAAAAVALANSAIAAYIRGPSAVTTGSITRFDASDSTLNDSIATYTWSIVSGGGSLTNQGTRTTLTAPNTNTTLLLRLDIADGHGQQSTVTQLVDVIGPPTARITGGNVVAAGQSINLSGETSSAQDGGVLAYAWSVNDTAATLSSPDSANTTLIAPNTANSVLVTLTVTDQAGGTHSTSALINVIRSGSNQADNGNGSSGGGGGRITRLGDLLMLLLLQVMRWQWTRPRRR